MNVTNLSLTVPFQVSLFWSMIKTVYMPRNDFSLQTPLREESAVRDRGGGGDADRKHSEDQQITDSAKTTENTSVEDSFETESDEVKEKTKSRKLRLEDLKPSSHSLGDFFFGDGEMDPLSMDFERGNSVSAMVDSMMMDWTLPTEAFQLRHEIKDQTPPPDQFPNSESPEPVEGIYNVTFDDFFVFFSKSRLDILVIVFFDP